MMPLGNLRGVHDKLLLLVSAVALTGRVTGAEQLEKSMAAQRAPSAQVKQLILAEPRNCLIRTRCVTFRSRLLFRKG